MLNQPIIPAIQKIKTFDQFLTSSLEVGFVMDIHINHLVRMIEKAHQHHKRLIVHIDMIKGISSDEEGCEFLCQTLKVDGIISTKVKVLEVARKNNRLSILRLFLIDSKSLNKGLELIAHYDFDYLEILPATCFDIIPYVIEHCQKPVIAGGLIQSRQDVDKCLSLGLKAVSTSRSDIWINS